MKSSKNIAMKDTQNALCLPSLQPLLSQPI
jgi:hypothetical protein